MRVPPFDLEVFFGKYEFSTPYLLAQSDCEAVRIDDLLRMEPDAEVARRDFLNTGLGYGENNGTPALRRAAAGLFDTMSSDAPMAAASSTSTLKVPRKRAPSPLNKKGTAPATLVSTRRAKGKSGRTKT